MPVQGENLSLAEFGVVDNCGAHLNVMQEAEVIDL